MKFTNRHLERWMTKFKIRTLQKQRGGGLNKTGLENENQANVGRGALKNKRFFQLVELFEKI